MHACGFATTKYLSMTVSCRTTPPVLTVMLLVLVLCLVVGCHGQESHRIACAQHAARQRPARLAGRTERSVAMAREGAVQVHQQEMDASGVWGKVKVLPRAKSMAGNGRMSVKGIIKIKHQISDTRQTLMVLIVNSTKQGQTGCWLVTRINTQRWSKYM